jgi:3-methyladenine DNA glycosylase Mpg
VDTEKIKVSKRIGVEGAGEAAHYPFRFVLDVGDKKT